MVYMSIRYDEDEDDDDNDDNANVSAKGYYIDEDFW